jgi:hypothetical protein
MTTRNVRTQEVQSSKNNFLYCIDESLLKFARDYQSLKESVRNDDTSTKESAEKKQ